MLAENLRQRAHKDAKILADAQALAETIANRPLTLAVKAEEGKLFGTVTATDLAEAGAGAGRSDVTVMRMWRDDNGRCNGLCTVCLGLWIQSRS